MWSEPLVESGVITSVVAPFQGTVLPLINWAGAPVYNLTLRLQFHVAFASAKLGSGHPLTYKRDSSGCVVFTLDLNIADAIVLRI